MHCTRYCAVLCPGIRASFSTAYVYRRLKTDSMRKNNIVRGVQIGDIFFVCYRPSPQISLSSQHKSLAAGIKSAQGKLGEGKVERERKE